MVARSPYLALSRNMASLKFDGALADFGSLVEVGALEAVGSLPKDGALIIVGYIGQLGGAK